MDKLSQATVVYLSRWREGDRKAADKLLVRDLEFVQREVTKRIGNVISKEGDPSDVVNDVMLSLLERGPTFTLSSREEFRNFLVRVITNKIKDRYRYLKAGIPDVKQKVSLPTLAAVNLDPPAKSAGGPGTAVVRGETLAYVELAKQLLTDTERQILELHLDYELPWAEIGQAVGLTAAAASMRFRRAVQRLASTIKDLERGRFSQRFNESEGEDSAPAQA